MRGGPICTYKGKEIPCFVGCSPNSSITSQMLADMLAVIDSSGVFNRDDGSTPFLLLDGHHSRFGLPFLKYIHEDKNKWTCCIGVPYGTHLWQVADSSPMNGCFKSQLTKAKRDLLSFNTKSTSRFVQSDVIPLVRKAWYASFAKTEKAKSAIADRGWHPLNYKLLDHPSLKPTSSEDLVQTLPDCPDSISINQDGPTFNSFLDRFIVEEAKKEGRKRKLADQQQRAETIDSTFALLTTFTSVAPCSGSMAKHNIYELVEGLLAKVREREDMIEKKKVRTGIRKYEQQQKHGVRFKTAFTKYREGKVLTREDIVALITKTKLPNDAPNGKNLKDLKLQWEERKHRLDDFIGEQTLNVNNIHPMTIEFPPSIVNNNSTDQIEM
jgi:hypothetical protein